MEYDFQDSYTLINGRIEVRLNMKNLKGKLSKAQSDLVY